MKKFILSALAMFMIGCSTYLPLQTIHEAFPNGMVPNNDSPPPESYRKATFDFGYSDIFMSAEKALSFAQINVTEINENAGFMYGVRSVGSGSKIFYLVRVKEDGPEKCTVSVYSKTQSEGELTKWFPAVILPSVVIAAVAFIAMPDDFIGNIALSSVYPAVMIPLTAFGNKLNKENNRMGWCIDEEYLDRIMSFLRTDLLQKR